MSKIIGIAGGSGGGKSTIAEKLATLYEQKNCRVKLIPMDWYYRDDELRPKVKSHISGICYTDDNCPDSFDFELAVLDCLQLTD